ncbi:MAG: thioesterase [Chloroflexi bacterium]|nr:thioesterase [Chloroflexota bacterium]
MIVTQRATQTDPWIARTTPRPRATSRLFCFTYAGGTAAAYRTWAAGLPASIEVCPVELPGRGTRLGELPYTRLPDLVRAAAPAILPYLDRPFAFFGHSMGALVAFELARHLRRAGGLSPTCLLVSAHRAPQVPDLEPPTYILPDRTLIDKLRALEGTPKEVLDQPELLRLLLPRLRADFEVCDTYEYRPDAPLSCPIAAFGGRQDKIVPSTDLADWRAQTTGDFRMHLLPGGHFYLHTSQPLLLHLVTQELEASGEGRASESQAA